MLKFAELADRTAKHLNVSPNFALKSIEAALQVLSEQFAQGEGVELGSFGEFRVREVPAHEGKNPHGGSFHIPTYRRPYFQPFRRLLKAMNPSREAKR